MRIGLPLFQRMLLFQCVNFGLEMVPIDASMARSVMPVDAKCALSAAYVMSR